MTIKTFSIVLTLAFAWMACNNDAPQSAAPTGETSVVTAPDANPQVNATQGITTPVTDASGALNPAPPAPATPAGGSTAKVNPPHGQPGHSCAVPVGAPLDGSATGNSKPAQNQPSAARPAAAPAPAGGATTVAPGTNPPHGQPGHVCSTPVGAPLPKQ